jgi:hypothetical protein
MGPTSQGCWESDLSLSVCNVCAHRPSILKLPSLAGWLLPAYPSLPSNVTPDTPTPIPQLGEQVLGSLVHLNVFWALPCESLGWVGENRVSKGSPPHNGEEGQLWHTHLPGGPGQPPPLKGGRTLTSWEVIDLWGFSVLFWEVFLLCWGRTQGLQRGGRALCH